MRKAFLTLAVVAAVVLVIVGRTRHHDAPTTAAPTSTSTTTAYTTKNLLDVDLAASTAGQFATLWSMPQAGDTSKTWEARLDGLVTADLGRGFLTTDLTYLPHQRLSTATPPDFRELSSTSATVVVTLADGEQIAVEVVRNGPAYAVSDVTTVGSRE